MERGPDRSNVDKACGSRNADDYQRGTSRESFRTKHYKPLTMLDFRRNSSSRSGQIRHERRRLLALVLLLGLTFLLICKASDPSVWRIFDLLFTPPQSASKSTEIDNRLDAVAANDTSANTFLASTDKPTPKSADVPGYFPGVDPRSLSSIRDDAPSSHDEQAYSLELLSILSRTDSATLDKASTGPVTYAQLFRQPNQYRGQLVTVSGIVRRANQIDLFPNEYGLKAYYQIWLWPTDNPSSPIVIYCLDLPKGFPTGMEFVEEAEVTGFFFKRWAYMAKDGLRTAPTILAKTLDWQKRPVMKAAEPAETWAIPLVVCVAVVVAMLIAFFIYLRTRPTRPTLPGKPPSFDGL